MDLDFVTLQSDLLDEQAKKSEEKRAGLTPINIDNKLNIPEGYGGIKDDIVKDEEK